MRVLSILRVCLLLLALASLPLAAQEPDTVESAGLEPAGDARRAEGVLGGGDKGGQADAIHPRDPSRLARTDGYGQARAVQQTRARSSRGR